MCLRDCWTTNPDSGRLEYFYAHTVCEFKKKMPSPHFQNLATVTEGAPKVTVKTDMKRRGVKKAPLSEVKYNPDGMGAQIGEE
jgi:hypothetical protein